MRRDLDLTCLISGNLLTAVTCWCGSTQPSPLHDSHSHAPAAFPMVVGISEQTPTRECGQGRRGSNTDAYVVGGRRAGCLVHHSAQCLPGPQSSSESSESSLGRFLLTFLRGFLGGSNDAVRLSGCSFGGRPRGFLGLS